MEIRNFQELDPGEFHETKHENPRTPHPSFKMSIKLKFVLLLTVAFIVVVAFTSIRIKHYKASEASYQAQIDDLNSRLESQTAMFDDKVTDEINLSLIESELKNIGELATMEYAYTDAGKFSDSTEIIGFTVPFSTKSFLVKWDGVIKAGIDVSSLTIYIDEDNKIMTITLPEAKILSHDIDHDSFETLDEKGGLFRPIEVDDVNTFLKESSAAMEKRAIENSLLERSTENTKTLIDSLLNANPIIKDNYTIVFN